MRIIAISTLKRFWEDPDHSSAEQPLKAWIAEARKAEWRSIPEVRASYRSADFPGDDRAIFNIGGNKYRLIVWMKFSAKILFIKWIGTHKEYDALDVRSVGLPAPRNLRGSKKK